MNRYDSLGLAMTIVGLLVMTVCGLAVLQDNAVAGQNGFRPQVVGAR